MAEMKMTRQQREIMALILGAADKGYAISMPQLRADLSYGGEVTKQAVLSSLRYLEARGMLTKEYGRGNKPMTMKPTALAYVTFRAAPEMPSLSGE